MIRWMIWLVELSLISSIITWSHVISIRMKKSTAACIVTTALQSPAITRTLPRYYQRKTRELPNVEPAPAPAPHRADPSPPSEDVITKLNGIGREYPFCVYYREKNNDPL
jgi:hypothetical protein